MEEMLDVVGINPDGTFQSGTASDGAIRQMILQIAQLAGNQGLREKRVKKMVLTQKLLWLNLETVELKEHLVKEIKVVLKLTGLSL